MYHRLSRRVFGLWPDLKTMSDDLDEPIRILRRQRDNFELPDPRHDLAICQVSMAQGKRIRVSDLLDARKKRPEIDKEERRIQVQRLVQAYGGRKKVSERTGISPPYISVMASRGLIPLKERRVFLEMAAEVDVELDEGVFHVPKD